MAQRFLWNFLSGRSSLDEISESHPDFRWRVPLDEMDPLDGDFLLIRPTPAEFPLSPCENGTWISVDKQLGHLAGRKPLSVSLGLLHRKAWQRLRVVFNQQMLIVRLCDTGHDFLESAESLLNLSHLLVQTA